VRRLAEAVEAPWGVRYERQIREAMESGAGTAASKAIAEVVQRLGLEPFKAPEPLPPIEEHECAPNLLDGHGHRKLKTGSCWTIFENHILPTVWRSGRLIKVSIETSSDPPAIRGSVSTVAERKEIVRLTISR
jgi:hypothetical protein